MDEGVEEEQIGKKREEEGGISRNGQRQREGEAVLRQSLSMLRFLGKENNEMSPTKL